MTTAINPKTKEAFKVHATIEGKSWETRSTVLTASNIEDAKIKGIKVMGLSTEHVITIYPVTVYSSDSVLTSDSYPYGRLKCTAKFSLEFTKNGFRTVFQTINPKNGRINNPKKSTYYPVILPMVSDNGHIGYCGYCDFNGSKAINAGCQFMDDFFELFSVEQIKDIGLTLHTMLKVDAKSQVIYCGTDWDKLKPLVSNQISNALNVFKTGDNLFQSCILDVAAIESLEVEGFQPFKVVEY
jgi:hypothetical protein